MKTRVLALIAIALTLAGCASSGGFNRHREPCPVVVVDNRAFEDIRLYRRSPHVRIGFVTGHTKEVFTVCPLAGRPALFMVRAMGSTRELTLDGITQYVSPGQRIEIVYGPTPNMSFVIGQASNSSSPDYKLVMAHTREQQ